MDQILKSNVEIVRLDRKKQDPTIWYLQKKYLKYKGTNG